ncbi:hypothetical protein [Holdemania massiliensis]|uniref:hypothetical protein n=1 Tax=Holdemania massiliensis TaxID=1468449 RepID=UPI001F0545C4|nr:hypothetical protein [Holdemania massiliensis]MCH1941816.1 hypothetical protein [Holdemania massiliensis]
MKTAMKKGLILFLICLLVAGCSSTGKSAITALSEEDYYLVTFRNVNNVGIFQFGNEETGMAYFDFATGKVISIPDKNMKKDPHMYPAYVAGIAYYNDFIYYVYHDENYLSLMRMDPDGNNVKELYQYKNKKYNEIMPDNYSFIYHDQKIYFEIIGTQFQKNGSFVEEGQLAYFDLKDNSLNLIYEPVLIQDPQHRKLIAVDHEKVFYKTVQDSKSDENPKEVLSCYNIETKETLVLEEAEKIRIASEKNIDLEKHCLYYLDQNYSLIELNYQQQSKRLLLENSEPIELRYYDQGKVFYFNMTVDMKQRPEKIMYGFFDVEKEQNFPDFNKEGQQFSIADSNDQYFIGKKLIQGEEVDSYWYYLDKEAYFNQEFELAKPIIGLDW